MDRPESGNGPERRDPSVALILALTAAATIAVIGVELLGAVGALERWPVAALLLVSIAGFVVVLHRGAPDLRPTLPRRGDLALVVVLVIVGGLTLVVAVLSPPNTWDSMTYHMARVAHWLDQGTLEFYPTSIDRQLWQPPFAEYLVLLGYASLGARDHISAVPQWVAGIGVAAAASAIAGLLGATPRYRLVAAVVVALSPSFILQSSSTQTDLLAALWLSVVAYLALENARRHTGSSSVLLFGAALGLAWGTKGTALPLSLPWVAVFLAGEARFSALEKAIGRAALGLTIAAGLNAARWQRNVVAFRSPIAPPSVQTLLRPASAGPLVVAANLATNASLHLGTPSSRLNGGLERFVRQAHGAVGLDPDRLYPYFGGYRIVPWSAHEDLAGSPIHLLIGLIGLGAAIRSWKRLDRLQRIAVVALGSGALLFAAAVRWQPYNARLHLPLIALSSPLIAVGLRRAGHLATMAVLVGLGLAAIPPLLLNANRPLVPSSGRSGPALSSILSADRATEYFNARPDLAPAYGRIVAAVAGSGCRRFGLVAGYDSWEYPLWALTRPPVSYQHASSTAEGGAPAWSSAVCGIVALDRSPDWQGPAGYRVAWRDGAFSVWLPR